MHTYNLTCAMPAGRASSAGSATAYRGAVGRTRDKNTSTSHSLLSAVIFDFLYLMTAVAIRGAHPPPLRHVLLLATFTHAGELVWVREHADMMQAMSPVCLRRSL